MGGFLKLVVPSLNGECCIWCSMQASARIEGRHGMVVPDVVKNQKPTIKLLNVQMYQGLQSIGQHKYGSKMIFQSV
jgi:hypothetical protein